MRVPDEADALFDVPPEEFVATRNALAKELRAAGERDVAAVVAKLKRPTATAHALNQVARRQPELVEAALAARAALRSESIGGGDVRAAATADRDATRAVVDAARAALGRDDPAFAQRVTATLLAAVVDDGVGAELRAGRLASEQTSPGFGFDVDDAEIIPFRPSPTPKAAERDTAAAVRAKRKAEAEHRKLVDRLASRAARLAEKADEAERVAAEARGEADAAAAELELAREDHPGDG